MADTQWRDTYTEWLGGEFQVRTATNPAEARQKLCRAIDVVVASADLLADDRLALSTIRQQTGTCHVVCIVQPWSVSIDCDGTVQRPATEDRLRETVGQHLTQTAYDRTLSSFYLKGRREGPVLNKRTEGERSRSRMNRRISCKQLRF